MMKLISFVATGSVLHTTSTTITYRSAANCLAAITTITGQIKLLQKNKQNCPRLIFYLSTLLFYIKKKRSQIIKIEFDMMHRYLVKILAI